MLGSSRERKAPKKAMDFMPSLRHKAVNMENKVDNNMERKKSRSKSPAKEKTFEEVVICLSYFLQTKNSESSQFLILIALVLLLLIFMVIR